MTVIVDGRQNRAAGRDYVEINFPGAEAELITNGQRRRLNKLVKDISAETQVHPRELWLAMHDSVGTNSISEMRRDQYRQAIEALQGIQARVADEAEIQMLIDLVLQVVGEKGLHADMVSYCLTEFGKQLNRLSQMQLAQVLKWVSAEPPKHLMLPGSEEMLQVCDESEELTVTASGKSSTAAGRDVIDQRESTTVSATGENSIAVGGDLFIGAVAPSPKGFLALNLLWAFIFLTAAGFIGRQVLSDAAVFDVDIGYSLARSALWAVILIAGYGLIPLWRWAYR